MAYRVAVIPMTLSDLEGIHLLQAFWNGIFRPVAQQSTRFQLCDRIDELLVMYNTGIGQRQSLELML